MPRWRTHAAVVDGERRGWRAPTGGAAPSKQHPRSRRPRGVDHLHVIAAEEDPLRGRSQKTAHASPTPLSPRIGRQGIYPPSSGRCGAQQPTAPAGGDGATGATAAAAPSTNRCPAPHGGHSRRPRSAVIRLLLLARARTRHVLPRPHPPPPPRSALQPADFRLEDMWHRYCSRGRPARVRRPRPWSVLQWPRPSAAGSDNDSQGGVGV